MEAVGNRCAGRDEGFELVVTIAAVGQTANWRRVNGSVEAPGFRIRTLSPELCVLLRRCSA